MDRLFKNKTKENKPLDLFFDINKETFVKEISYYSVPADGNFVLLNNNTGDKEIEKGNIILEADNNFNTKQSKDVIDSFYENNVINKKFEPEVNLEHTSKKQSNTNRFKKYAAGLAASIALFTNLSVKAQDSTNIKNNPGFNKTEQNIFNKASKNEAKEIVLNRKDDLQKGIYNKYSKAENSNIYYYEVARGHGEHWEKTNREKSREGSMLYSTEEDVNRDKIKDPASGVEVSMHNPKGVDLKIDGNFYPVELGSRDYIAPLPTDMVALETVYGGPGFVKLPKGRLVVMRYVGEKYEKPCYRIEWDYVCQNPIMAYKLIKNTTVILPGAKTD